MTTPFETWAETDECLDAARQWADDDHIREGLAERQRLEGD